MKSMAEFCSAIITGKVTSHTNTHKTYEKIMAKFFQII